MSTLIAPIVNVISGAENIANVLIDDAIQQKYEKAKENRFYTLQNILTQPDSVSRAQQLNDYFVQLTTDAGSPARGLGPNISVPLDFLQALATIAGAKIEDDIVIKQETSKLVK